MGFQVGVELRVEVGVEVGVGSVVWIRICCGLNSDLLFGFGFVE